MKSNNKKKRCVAMSSSASEISGVSEFGKDLGLMHEVVVTGRKCGITRKDWSVLAHNEDKMRGIAQYLHDEVDLVPKTKPAPESEAEVNTLIRIDRSVKLVYPDWVKEIADPELEGVGPAEYDMTKVELWPHDNQKYGGFVTIRMVYDYLKSSNKLRNCLGLEDALEIQKNGIVAFRKVFGYKVPICLRSVVVDQNGWRVPYFFGSVDEIVQHWFWLDRSLNDDNPVVLFPTTRIDVVGSPLSGNFGP